MVAAWTALPEILAEIADHGFKSGDLVGPAAALVISLLALVALARYFVVMQKGKDEAAAMHAQRLEKVIEGVTQAVTQASESNRAGNECIRENTRVMTEISGIIKHCKDREHL